MQALLSLSISILAGLMLSRLAKKLQLPAVTAYLVAGVLIGPFVLGQLGVAGLGFVSIDDVKSYEIICDVALGFIAFSIGNEFRVSQLKKIGKQATVIGILQAVITTLLVDAALIGLHFILGEETFSLSSAIVLGAIASATAPAATLMVVKQYKAKGPLTDMLLPVVAIDDAVGLVLFAISLGVARSISTGNVSIAAVILEPLFEVVLSLALGSVLGFLFNYSERFFHSNSKRLAMSICFVLLAVALSSLDFHIGEIHVAFSSLLVCMMLGTIFCNVCDFSDELMARADRWSGPVVILFFVLSGAELELSVFKNGWIVLIGVIYIIARSVGKYYGASVSSKMTKCDDTIVKYLGITLLPQAGVALGMAMKTKAIFVGELSNIATIVANITLFAVLIYELFGPMLTKISLTKAGDIKPDEKKSARTKDTVEFRRPHEPHPNEHHRFFHLPHHHKKGE